MATQKTPNPELGFSLIELLIGMAITLTVLGLAGNLLAGSFNVRARENQKTDALADAQRALNIMTREIANTGFGLANNGIVAADSTASAIRIRSNLNAFDSQTTSNSINDRNEDVKYSLYSAGTDSYIVRLDIGTQNQTTVLANRVDTLNIRYYPAKITYTATGSNCDISTTSSEVTQKSDTKYIVISVCVELPARGAPGSAGYQPVSRVQLVSDVYLRNADVANY
ncbi:MAG TPA: prepilin-type N-terminal cleavage/methylation domain-containing protein [Pyrinomonadaceae bacterium]|jgi:Tfp pilus assembly protein PilW|nr:prepilin-type N-terminal cleavage/methylation domain-containing protein [Pyrinomonadaceae bacterium]